MHHNDDLNEFLSDLDAALAKDKNIESRFINTMDGILVPRMIFRKYYFMRQITGGRYIDIFNYLPMRINICVGMIVNTIKTEIAFQNKRKRSKTDGCKNLKISDKMRYEVVVRY